MPTKAEQELRQLVDALWAYAKALAKDLDAVKAEVKELKSTARQ